ncbi:DEAD/DEAH box helicase [Isoptericola sp. b515]|uniref:DEAD/DEAH box helicase n=1 Tax=Isoptericola sp. b515 TaxID=3064652 RepID=UPI002714493B|nr:DEAD/DEAH box helicase [Isoptericola sp. b515]MDO8148531.1 DEAD/DEAH box helicase [Isoptericola sp. b515]
MPTVPPRVDPLEIGGLVGATTFRRAQGYERGGMVVSWSWDAEARVLAARVAGSAVRPYGCRIRFTVDADGRYAVDEASCSCPVATDCKHVAAALLHVGRHGADGPGGQDAPGGWRGRLAAVTSAGPDPASAGAVLPVGLRFRLDGAFAEAPPELSVRPVVPARNGGWKTAPEAGWEALARGLYAFADVRATPAPAVRRWFADLGAALSDGVTRSREAWRPLATAGRGLWPLLAEAAELQIPLVGQGSRDEVLLGRTASLRLTARSVADGVRLDPVVSVDGEDVVGPERQGAVGTSGLFTVETRGGRTLLRLAPTGARLTDGARELVGGGSLDVPAADVDELVGEHLPALRRAVTVVSDGSVELPEPARPVLVARADFDSPQRAVVRWSWRYPRPAGAPREVPLDGAAHDPSRGPEAEDEIRAAAVAAVRGLAGFERFEIARQQTYTGLEALDLAGEVLPALAGAGVVVEAPDVPDYQHLDAPPRVVVDGAASGDADWLDLGISVTVAGREVPFTRLFTALVRGQKRLLLTDGSWLRLNHASLRRLRNLVDEASALEDVPGRLRVSRYDAELWGELEDLADSVDVSARWRRTVADLRLLAAGDRTVAPVPAPPGLCAELRPYQHRAYEWLSFLHGHGLGGILADDMGLGKTLEVLAFVAGVRVRAEDGPRRPFVVVAPASVVGNWVDEAARFTPDLRVVPVPSTTKKLGRSLADLTDGADVVVVSYAVFRLDVAAFEGRPWAGLVLDEAQFAKNPRTRAHQTARRLDAPFKLAVTGTPLENNLTELWAMLAIVAPGLYPSSHRFRAEVVRPVEAAARDDDPQVVAAGNRALGRLQRRLRTLLLRRTKEQVAPELPARTEQVLRVPLTADHRKIYDTHLQRERQRLLGLLTDFEANRAAIFRSLTTLRRLALDAALVDDAYAGVTSAKLDLVVDQLVELVAEGHRALVFSQFPSFLRRVAARCAQAGLATVSLDGSTRDRSGVIAGFKAGEAPVFLISLKAGGFGLNLTEADHVYLLDPWWNPAAEAQAIDRTHRIGQTRPVQVTRLVAADTIEEKVMALARRKAALFDAVVDDATARFAGVLDADDVRGLLGA